MTYADSAPTALGTSRNRPTAVTPPQRHHIPAVDLQIGDHIQDRGARHTIDAIRIESLPLADRVTVWMEDGAHLTIPVDGSVTIWRDTPITSAGDPGVIVYGTNYDRTWAAYPTTGPQDARRV